MLFRNSLPRKPVLIFSGKTGFFKNFIKGSHF